MTRTDLPIEAALPALLDALEAQGRAVLQAPPGAGKTTRVPLALLEAGWPGRILMLEPRRLAARAAAERMAATLGEPVGETVGYRIRGEAKVSRQTRIEVVTEGILTRMIQSDPELSGVGVVIFDEFHERSLNADLGLALCWEIRGALREDLGLLVMSATLDAEPVARLLDDAPIITSDGRSHPVETRWLEKPLPPKARYPEAVAGLIRKAVAETEGGILCFLPGEGEIRRVQALLADLPGGISVHPLYGAMDFKAQRAAIAPPTEGCKLVLATSIAETSLTIDGIRVVVDGGRARRARFDPASGMSRLVTERVTRAEATQRQGRAGRLAPGICYRLWTKGEEGGLLPFAPAEIERADLAGFALELALWGTRDAGELALLTTPPPGALAEARALLRQLGALEADGAITAHGRAIAAHPVHPRLAHMLLTAGKQAAPLAALLSDRDPLRGAPVDLDLRLRALRDPKSVSPPPNPGALARIREEARRLARGLPEAPAMSAGEMAALAYPDRIGLRRRGDAPRWVLSGGKGATMADTDPFGSARLLVATDLDGDAREAKIRQAALITESELRALFADRIEWVELCRWNRRERRVEARRQERLGALVLEDRLWKDAPEEARARAALEGLRDLGLRLSPAAERFRARVELLRSGGAQMPPMDGESLLAEAEDWLLPHLAGVRTEADLRALDLLEPLRQRLDWDQLQRLDREAPSHFTSPLGNRIPIDYAGEAPAIELRLQEMFGTTVHPTVGPQRLPLRVTLLSPARRPVQTTMDIPAFWATSYADVRKDMRGRYPKHPWPEDPTQADPTLRAKPRR
ncbi:ATP-dependent RNA helicase HrpB [Pseudoruegeria aquimaris]|uniref:ATP-dependent RNA helicase HrpB n=1 Tax=Pseudoruegeria aquimaris TaxID=393663 RepID=A0A1Y5SKA7_9RHOB|nr:ATP-dependent helicase HrpB [Pseudoruegeria aquimaris]SLN39645.1 ATP-dependent RNA helicase HrpB [Pseudoruegeria aquimaris]